MSADGKLRSLIVCDNCEEPAYIRKLHRKDEVRPGLIWAHRADNSIVCTNGKGIRPKEMAI